MNLLPRAASARRCVLIRAPGAPSSFSPALRELLLLCLHWAGSLRAAWLVWVPPVPLGTMCGRKSESTLGPAERPAQLPVREAGWVARGAAAAATDKGSPLRSPARLQAARRQGAVAHGRERPYNAQVGLSPLPPAFAWHDANEARAPSHKSGYGRNRTGGAELSGRFALGVLGSLVCVLCRARASQHGSRRTTTVRGDCCFSDARAMRSRN